MGGNGSFFCCIQGIRDISISITPEFQSVNLPFITEDREYAIAWTVSQFPFSRENIHSLKAVWHADIYSIVAFLVESSIMKLFSERKFSRVGK